MNQKAYRETINPNKITPNILNKNVVLHLSQTMYNYTHSLYWRLRISFLKGTLYHKIYRELKKNSMYKEFKFVLWFSLWKMADKRYNFQCLKIAHNNGTNAMRKGGMWLCPSQIIFLSPYMFSNWIFLCIGDTLYLRYIPYSLFYGSIVIKQNMIEHKEEHKEEYIVTGKLLLTS